MLNIPLLYLTTTAAIQHPTDFTSKDRSLEHFQNAISTAQTRLLHRRVNSVVVMMRALRPHIHYTDFMYIPYFLE